MRRRNPGVHGGTTAACLEGRPCGDAERRWLLACPGEGLQKNPAWPRDWSLQRCEKISPSGVICYGSPGRLMLGYSLPTRWRERKTDLGLGAPGARLRSLPCLQPEGSVPARVPTSLCYLHEAVSGGMGRRQKDAFGGLGEPKLFLSGAPFQHAAVSRAMLQGRLASSPHWAPHPDGRAVHRSALASVSREGCRGPGCTEMFRQSASGRGRGRQDLWRSVRRRLARCWPSGGVRTESVKGESQGEGREAGGAASHRALQTTVRARDGPLVTWSRGLWLSSRGDHVRMWREGT